MSRRRQDGNDVRGPTSALTSFLREKGIRAPTGNRFSRTQQQDAAPPQPAADVQDQGEGSSKRPREDDIAEDDGEEAPVASTSAAPSPKKPKLNAKKQKALAKKKAEIDAEVSELGFEAPKGRYANRTPGAFNNCAECGNRFTYTKYTATSADGVGVMCPACQKEAGISMATGPKQPAVNRTRAIKPKAPVLESKKAEIKTLQNCCIRLIGKHISQVEEIGEVGSVQLDNICKIVCKNRGLNEQTLKLFLDVDQSKLALYDCAMLNEDGLQQITIFAPKLKYLTLNYCGALKDVVLNAIMARMTKLQRVELYGPFLVTATKWKAFFDSFLVGDREPLNGFLIRQSPRFDSSCVLRLAENFPNLTELRLAEIGQLNDDCLTSLYTLTNLTYLDLSCAGVDGNSLTDDGVVPLLEHVGANLRTLILSDNANLADRTLLEGIRPHCHALRHLSLSLCQFIEDAGVVGLFTDWSANTGLESLDLSRCIEVGNEGISTAVTHSGKTLIDLNLNSVDKSVTEEGLKAIAAGCEALVKLDLGFVRALDDFLLKDIFEGCSNLRWVSVFGCNRVTDFAPSRAGVKIVGGEGNFKVRD